MTPLFGALFDPTLWPAFNIGTKGHRYAVDACRCIVATVNEACGHLATEEGTRGTVGSRDISDRTLVPAPQPVRRDPAHLRVLTGPCGPCAEPDAQYTRPSRITPYRVTSHARTSAHPQSPPALPPYPSTVARRPSQHVTGPTQSHCVHTNPTRRKDGERIADRTKHTNSATGTNPHTVNTPLPPAIVRT